MLRAHLAQAPEEGGRGGHVAALAEDGLDDERGGVVWGGLLLEEEVELVQAVRGEGFGGGVAREAALVPVGIGDGEHPRLQCTCEWGFLFVC